MRLVFRDPRLSPKTRRRRQNVAAGVLAILIALSIGGAIGDIVFTPAEPQSPEVPAKPPAAPPRAPEPLVPALPKPSPIREIVEVKPAEPDPPPASPAPTVDAPKVIAPKPKAKLCLLLDGILLSDDSSVAALRSGFRDANETVMRELIVAGMLFTVDPGTRAEVLADEDGLTRVRVAAAAQQGRIGWVRAGPKYCQPFRD